MELSGWGRFPRADCRVVKPRTVAQLRAALADGPVIARGRGRAYGDSALNRDATLDMTGFRHMLAFDGATGVLTAEAGVTLEDIIATFLPRGWFPPVVPGTKFVTLGGMVAADVHGKNHHRDGAFGNFIEWIDVLGADGETRRCSPADNADLFAATVGGMGLTGIVVRAAVRLMPVESAWLRVETQAAPTLADAMAAFEETADRTYSVAWIDCLAPARERGRSVLYLGEHAAAADLPARHRAAPFAGKTRRRLNVPVTPPAWLLSGPTVRAFNAAYWRRARGRAEDSFVDWDAFFFPLDGLHNWNRLYGGRGFMQFQCVIPLDAAPAGIAELLAAVSDAGAGSFLAVLKRMGRAGAGISFPMPGYTLALDFPVSARTRALVDRLDEIAVSHGGRFYLAKDSRMKRSTLEQADARVPGFRAFRAETGATSAFASLQSERLSL